ncbi:MAG TPA: Hsp70 family protein [Pseudonocardiaceae bacterium]|nr:Hsp70 family protein [Pseudonocardiaceae bacterium]
MSYGLGIDVGNTSVVVAVTTTTGIEMFTFGDRAVARSAAVHLRGDGAPTTGEAASCPPGSSQGRTIGGFMSRLGDQEPMTFGGAPYTVTDLIGILLHDVLEEVTAAHGAQPDHVVLTHPASWDRIRRELFEEATRRAGLRKALIVTEPEAAATYYSASQRWSDGDIVAVYDLGSTTFNATVLLKSSGGIHILGEPERVEHLGGEDFDDAILSHVNDTLDSTPREPGTTRSPEGVAPGRARQDCIRAKEALSVDVETVVQVLLPGRRREVRITRPDFEDIARPPIERTIDTLSQALRSAQVAPADLSAVLLVGGSSRIPLVAQMVSAKLGAPTVMDPHPQHVIALGAAMLAAHAIHADLPQQDKREQRDGVRQEGQRLVVNGITTSTLTARSGVDVTEQHGTAPQRPAGMIPTQRTPPQETPSAAAHTAAEDSEAGRDMLTVQIPAPAVTPRRMLQPRSYASLTPAVRSMGTPPRRSSGSRRIRPQVLLICGMTLGGLVVALVGSILLALFGGKSGARVPAPLALAQTPKPETTIIPDQPAVTIPAVAATIPLSANPTFVTVSPDSKHAYIAQAEAQAVTVVDTENRHVIATIPIAAGPPQFLALAPNGRTLYISIFNDQRTIHSVDVLDTGSNTVVATIPQPARPFLPAVSPDGKRLYVPNHDVAAVSVIDTVTHAVIAQIPVPPNPHWVDFSPDGSRAYTANHESNLVASIDTTTLKVLNTVPVGISPHSVAVNPHRPLAANVNFDSASVSVIDTIKQSIAATIPVGQNPQDIAWSPDGRFAYVVNQGSNTISVIDSTTNQVTTTIPTGAGPTSIALLPHSHQAYVSDMDGKTLTVLDLAR